VKRAAPTPDDAALLSKALDDLEAKSGKTQTGSRAPGPAPAGCAGQAEDWHLTAPPHSFRLRSGFRATMSPFLTRALKKKVLPASAGFFMGPAARAKLQGKDKTTAGIEEPS
jgi:hypothetical protein